MIAEEALYNISQSLSLFNGLFLILGIGILISNIIIISLLVKIFKNINNK